MQGMPCIPCLSYSARWIACPGRLWRGGAGALTGWPACGIRVRLPANGAALQLPLQDAEGLQTSEEPHNAPY